MIKDYNVNIPPLFSEVLANIGNVSPSADFDDIIAAARASFFSFYTPKKITATQAEDLEKFILNYYVMRRVGSGNVKKFKQIFKNKWYSVIDYYERLIDTQENETNYFENPILNANYTNSVDGSGTVDTTENHSNSNSDSGSTTEIDRYSDTPQGDSSQIWETYTDAQGHTHVRLTDLYLTDIRGITTNYSRTGSDSGDKTIDTDTTKKETADKVGFDGVSPAELLQKYRETFLRIYEDFAAEFESCFYNLVEVDDLINYV